MSAYGDPKRGSPVPPYHPSTPLNQAPPGVYGAYQPVSYAYIAPVTHTAPPVIPVVLVQDGGFRRLWRSTFCTIIMWTMIALIVPRIVVELFWHKHHFHAGWVRFYLSGTHTLPYFRFHNSHGFTGSAAAIWLSKMLKSPAKSPF